MQPPELLNSDEFLRFREGDKQVFRKIYDAYFGIINYTVNRCRIVDDNGLDIIQETFLRLYQHRNAINNSLAIKSWLITTARNLAIDYLRRQKHESSAIQSRHQAHHIDDLYREPFKSVTHELELLLIGDLIDEVTRQTNDDTFVLFYKEGLSAQEIATRHNEALGTVTNRLSRLRKKFRDRFRKKLCQLRDSDVTPSADI